MNQVLSTIPPSSWPNYGIPHQHQDYYHSTGIHHQPEYSQFTSGQNVGSEVSSSPLELHLDPTFCEDWVKQFGDYVNGGIDPKQIFPNAPSDHYLDK